MKNQKSGVSFAVAIMAGLALLSTSAMAEPDFTAVTAAITATAIVTAISAVAAIKILPGVATWGFNKVIGWIR